MTTTHGQWPELLFAADYSGDPAALTRAVRRGTLHRIARGVYSGATDVSAEGIVRRHLWRIVARLYPGAVIADRSVLDGGLARDGRLFIVHSRAVPSSFRGLR